MKNFRITFRDSTVKIVMRDSIVMAINYFGDFGEREIISVKELDA